MTHAPDATPPRILIVEDDRAIAQDLLYMLAEERYEVELATTLDEALGRVDERVYRFILTDLFGGAPDEALHSIKLLQTRAFPIPVGALTAWLLPPTAAEEHGLACLILKPFRVDDTLRTIATCVHPPLSAAQERQVGIIEQYCAAINRGDLDGCLALCADDVAFIPPPQTVFAYQSAVRGRAAFRKYSEVALSLTPGYHFEKRYIFPQPEGLAMRFEQSFETATGVAPITAGLLFQFHDDLINQIEARVNPERLRAILPSI